jgi:predicted nucleic acid-binding protein
MKGLLRQHSVIALDTSVFIYHFEDHPQYRDITTVVLDAVSRGECRAIVSELSLMELIVRPLRMELQDVADEYEALLSHFPHLTLEPVTRAVVLKAAAIRAGYGLRTPDAMIIASAVVRNATLVITKDIQWKRVREVAVACLDDFR